MLFTHLIVPLHIKNIHEMELYPKKIMEALATVTYAGTKKNLVESDMVADTPTVAWNEERGVWMVTVVLLFPRETDPFLKSTVKECAWTMSLCESTFIRI